jgi:hypothetical protein
MKKKSDKISVLSPFPAIQDLTHPLREQHQLASKHLLFTMSFFFK